MHATLRIIATAIALAACGAAGAVTPTAPPSETIQQRDAQGRVRVYREVRLNPAGDYVNHGLYREWDDQGRLVGQGRYAWGEATGAWSRWLPAAESPLLGGAPFCAFDGPFLSQVDYLNGRPHGVWRIYSADSRLVCEAPLREGLRHGQMVLYQPDGSVFYRQSFSGGAPDGQIESTDENGKLRVVAEFESGRRRIERTERYESGAMKSYEQWLGPLARAAESDDPWLVRLAAYEESGEELRHGRRDVWWPNGQKKLAVEYRHGDAVGEAQWWHENGQLAVRGGYENGLADGVWSWWRESGARRAACRYSGGRPEAAPQLWAADGRRLEATAERVASLGAPGAVR